MKVILINFTFKVLSSPKFPVYKKTRSASAKGITESFRNRESKDDFYEFIQHKIAPEIFAKFDDFGEFHLDLIFDKSRLDVLVNHKNQNNYYPDLMALFHGKLDWKISDHNYKNL